VYRPNRMCYDHRCQFLFFLVATCDRTHVLAMAVYDSTPGILDRQLIRLCVWLSSTWTGSSAEAVFNLFG
jgi:hypothetical protein